MADIRERGVRGSSPPRSQSKVSVRKPPARRSRVPDLQRFISDFKTGLGTLKALTQRMAAPQSKPLNENASTTTRVEHHEIMRTLEREIRVLERTAPPEIRERVVSAFRAKAESAIHMGIPQAYAQLVGAVKHIPAKALRPNQSPAVRSLLSTVKALKSGRLAFLPRETRVAARKLLRGIFGSPKAGNTPSGRQTASTIEQQRLLPSVVQGLMRSYEKPEQFTPYVEALQQAKNHYFLPELSAAPAAAGGATPKEATTRAAPPLSTTSGAHVPPSEAPPLSTIGGAHASSSEAPPLSTIGGAVALPPEAVNGPAPGHPVSAPLSPHATAQMAKTIPSFNTAGVAHSFSYEPGDESIHTITKNDGLMTEADMAPMSGSKMGANAPASSAASRPAVMPPIAESNSTAPSGVQEGRGGGGGDSSPVTVTGSLAIDGLPEFIARTELRLSGLERAAGEQNG